VSVYIVRMVSEGVRVCGWMVQSIAFCLVYPTVEIK